MRETTSGKGQESLSLWTWHPRSIWEAGQEWTDSQGSRPGLVQCTLVAWFWGNLIKFEWQREFLRVTLARSTEKPRGIGEIEGDAGCLRGYPGLSGE